MAGTIDAIDGNPCMFAGIAESYSARLVGAWTDAEKAACIWTVTNLATSETLPAQTGASTTIIAPDSWDVSACSIAVQSGDGATKSSLAPVPVVRYNGKRFAMPDAQQLGISVTESKPKPSRSEWRAAYKGQPEYFIGVQMPHPPVAAGKRVGIASEGKAQGPEYVPEAWAPLIGQWAWMVKPTLTAEGLRGFDAFNSYDRARFTFGLAQMSLSAQGDGLVTLLRRFLAKRGAPAPDKFFPEMQLDANLVKPISGLPVVNNSNDEWNYLRDHFNSTFDKVEADEARAAATLIAWSRSDPALCHLQVLHLCAFWKAKLAIISSALLDQRTDEEVLVIADILHQGRASRVAIEDVLRKNPAGTATATLLTVGATKYAPRIRTLKQVIKQLRDAAILGKFRWDAATKDMVPIPQSVPRPPLQLLLPELSGIRGVDQPGAAPEFGNGIRIGFGYKLREVTEQQLRTDWSQLPQGILDQLSKAVGIGGDAARALAKSFDKIVIDETVARAVFSIAQGPPLLSRAGREWVGFTNLPMPKIAALVSLWLDVGMQLRDAAFGSGERRPLRKLRKGLLGGSAPKDLADHFRQLQTLGDQQRRNKEADVFMS